MKKTAALWLTVFLFSAFFCGCQGDPPPGNAGSGESVSDSSSVPVPVRPQSRTGARTEGPEAGGADSHGLRARRL